MIEAAHKTVCFAVYNHIPNSKPVDRTQRLFEIFNKRDVSIFVAVQRLIKGSVACDKT